MTDGIGVSGEEEMERCWRWKERDQSGRFAGGVTRSAAGIRGTDASHHTGNGKRQAGTPASHSYSNTRCRNAYRHAVPCLSDSSSDSHWTVRLTHCLH